MRRARSSERGAALFAVLAMLALLSGLATIGLSRLKAATDDARGSAELAEAQLAALSATALARTLVAQVKAQANRDISIIQRPITLPVGTAMVTFRFRDAGTCFNLNGIGDGRQLASLLALSGIPRLDAERIAAATRARLGTRGLLLADPSEWQAMVGLPPEQYARVSRHLCTLPTREASSFNVNALAEADMPLLLSMGIARESAARFTANRPEGGFRSMNEAWGEAQDDGTRDSGPGNRIGTTSRWYALDIEVETETYAIGRRILLDSGRQPAEVAMSEWVPPRRRAPAT
ncbi:MAG: hypothetical protein SNJ63_01265 [Sphingomonadaceae bacterium]